MQKFGLDDFSCATSFFHFIFEGWHHNRGPSAASSMTSATSYAYSSHMAGARQRQSFLHPNDGPPITTNGDDKKYQN